jgi:hypothetical protein
MLALSYWHWGVIKRHAASLYKGSILVPLPAFVVITPYGVSHACTFQFGLILRENRNICWTRYIYMCRSNIYSQSFT